MYNKIGVVRSLSAEGGAAQWPGFVVTVEAEVTKNVAASNLHLSCFFLSLFLCFDMMNTTVGSDEAPFLIKSEFWSLIFSPPDQTLSEVPSN